jgi:hypothetical protein
MSLPRIIEVGHSGSPDRLCQECGVGASLMRSRALCNSCTSPSIQAEFSNFLSHDVHKINGNYSKSTECTHPFLEPRNAFQPYRATPRRSTTLHSQLASQLQPPRPLAVSLISPFPHLLVSHSSYCATFPLFTWTPLPLYLPARFELPPGLACDHPTR